MSPRSGRRGKGRGNPVSRTSELARKRERRSFRLRLFAFVGLLVILIGLAGYQFWLRDSSLVEIKNLEIVGVSDKTKEDQQIEGAVRTAMGEMTTLNVKPEILDQELARFPRVANAEIETSFPNSATVTVVIRKDGSVMGSGSDALLIATDGTVLGPAAGQEESLPLIGDPRTGETAESPQPGSLLTGPALAQALVLGATPPELRSFVSQSRSTRQGVLIEVEGGPTLLFGTPAQSDQKWRTAAALIADPGFDTDSYVDLTVPRRPAVSPEAPVGGAIGEGQP